VEGCEPFSCLTDSDSGVANWKPNNVNFIFLKRNIPAIVEGKKWKEDSC
jgi:hypothetical protein